MANSSSAARNLLVGGTFLGSLVLLGITSMAVGALPFLGQRTDIEVRFPNVDNLQVGDSVLVHGYRVGMVDAIRYEPSNRELPVAIVCALRESVRLTSDTQFSVNSTSALGGRHVEILPGSGDPVSPGEVPFRGTAPGDVFAGLRDVTDTLAEDSEEAGIIPYLINNSEARRKLDEVIENVRLLVEDAREGRGVLGAVFSDPVLKSDVQNAVAEIRETFRSLNASDGIVGALLNDRVLRDELVAAINGLSRGLIAEEGIIGYLLNSVEGREKLASALTRVEELLTGIGDQQGILGRLALDPELSVEIEEMIEAVHDIVHKINAGDGTLGQILNNPRGWNELIRILVLARETLEDLREQAPVSTFVNAAFAGF